MVSHLIAELQIRGGIEDNLKIIFLISQQKHAVTPQWNCLGQTVLMMGCHIVLKEYYGKLSLNNPFYPFLSGALSLKALC